MFSLSLQPSAPGRVPGLLRRAVRAVAAAVAAVCAKGQREEDCAPIRRLRSPRRRPTTARPSAASRAAFARLMRLLPRRVPCSLMHGLSRMPRRLRLRSQVLRYRLPYYSTLIVAGRQDQPTDDDRKGVLAWYDSEFAFLNEARLPTHLRPGFLANPASRRRRLQHPLARGTSRFAAAPAPPPPALAAPLLI